MITDGKVSDKSIKTLFTSGGKGKMHILGKSMWNDKDRI